MSGRGLASATTPTASEGGPSEATTMGRPRGGGGGPIRIKIKKRPLLTEPQQQQQQQPAGGGGAGVQQLQQAGDGAAAGGEVQQGRDGAAAKVSRGKRAEMFRCLNRSRLVKREPHLTCWLHERQCGACRLTCCPFVLAEDQDNKMKIDPDPLPSKTFCMNKNKCRDTGK